MPKAQVKKETPVSTPLAEGKARVRHKKDGKVIQGKYEVLEHKATLGALSAFCDIHEIRYPGGGTVEQLVALVKRK